MNPLQKKLEALSQEKVKIETEIKALQRKYHEELLQALDTLSLSSIDIPTLIGGIHFVIQKASEDTHIREEWRQAGQKFCNIRSSQKNRKASKQSEKTATEKE